MYPTTTTGELCTLLTNESEPLDRQACLERAKTRLQAKVDERVSFVKDQACSYIHRGYPASQEEGAELESPKQYSKRHNLAGTWRPQLRQVQATTISKSKQRLVSAIQHDTSHMAYGLGIDDEELLKSVQACETEIAERIAKAVKTIRELMPERRVPYDSSEVTWLRAAGYNGFKSVDPPADKTQRHHLQVAMTQLKKAVTDFRKGTDFVAAEVADRHLPQVLDRLERQLVTHYRYMMAAAQQALAAELTAAYDHTTHLGPQYEPNLPEDDQPAAETPASSVTKAEESQAAPVEVIRLGELPSPFPWLPDQAVAFSVLKQNGSSLVFCEALSPAARSISNEVRRESQTGRNLDRLWAMVKQKELTNPNGTHEWIKKVDDVTNEDFKDLLILGYGNQSPNAKRIYYSKTTTERYDGIDSLLAAIDLATPQPLLILIAETDKANQLRTYANFGISRAHAKAKNVGSI